MGIYILNHYTKREFKKKSVELCFITAWWSDLLYDGSRFHNLVTTWRPQSSTTWRTRWKLYGITSGITIDHFCHALLVETFTSLLRFKRSKSEFTFKKNTPLSALQIIYNFFKILPTRQKFANKVVT